MLFCIQYEFFFYEKKGWEVHVFMGFELMMARGSGGIDDQCNLLLFSLYIDWRVDTAAL
jgi:hypothetical protein